MTIEEVIKLAYFRTDTSETDYPIDYCLQQLNTCYRELRKEIILIDEKYFWNYWTTNIQEGVNEYAIQRKELEGEDEDGQAIKIPGIAKVSKIYIKNSVGKYVLLPELDFTQIDDGMKGWYLADNHIILTREPEEDIEDGLKLEGIQTVNDLTLDSVEEEIFPGHEDLSDYSDLLSLSLEYELRDGKQNFDKADRIEAKIQTKKAQMIRYVTQRVKKSYLSQMNY